MSSIVSVRAPIRVFVPLLISCCLALVACDGDFTQPTNDFEPDIVIYDEPTSQDPDKGPTQSPNENPVIDDPETAANTPEPVSPVFEGAEGFGSYTVAGRGGVDCWVTNLNDSGEGSLRSCVSLADPRQVKFSVSGRIHLLTSLELTNPYISILGQTAPGNGILLSVSGAIDGPVLSIKTHDVLVQHLRIRAGATSAPSCCRDAVSIGSDVPNQVFNVVIDHNSLSWATDEVIDVWFDSRDITISRNIISEGLNRSTNKKGPAGRGLLVGSQARSVSVHHNLFAHNYERNPSITGVGVTDVVNNIIYHWVSRGAQLSARSGLNQVNMVKNLFIAHPESQLQPSAVNWYDISLDGGENDLLSVYFEGNLGHWRQGEHQPEWSLAGSGYKTPYDAKLNWHSESRHFAPAITEHPVNQLEDVLMNDVGATLPARDSVDKRVINELIWRSGYMPDCVEGCELHTYGWPLPVQ